MNLYDISNEYLTNLKALKELGIDDVSLEDTLESLQGDIRLKALNICLFMESIKAECISIKEAEDKLLLRREKKEKLISSLNNYLLSNLLACKINQIKSDLIDIKVVTNPSSVEVTDMSRLSKDFMKTETVISVNKVAIKNAFAKGEEVEGAVLCQSKRLKISI